MCYIRQKLSSFLWFIFIFSICCFFNSWYSVPRLLIWLNWFIDGSNSILNDKRHVLFARQIHLFPLPQRIMNGEGINCNGQMFCMDLREAFATGVISEIANKKNSIIKISFKKNMLELLFFFVVVAENLLEKLIEHEFIDLTRSRSVQFQHRLIFRPITVQRPKLASSITK